MPLHDHHHAENAQHPAPTPDPAALERELRPHGDHDQVAAAAIKTLRVRFADDLTPQQLRELDVLSPGSWLEHGAHYLDLANLPAGEFTAMGSIEVQPDHYYVAKKDTEYALWDRLKELSHAAAATSPAPEVDSVALTHMQKPE